MKSGDSYSIPNDTKTVENLIYRWELMAGAVPALLPITYEMWQALDKRQWSRFVELSVRASEAVRYATAQR